MILVIDTSSATSAIALLDESGHVVTEELHPSGRGLDLPGRFRALAYDASLTRVAVAAGPGSFTGLRAGVSFGLGLAFGLRVPILALPTLAIQAARAIEPVLALAEAGRGRVYFLSPGGEAAIGEPAELPATHRAVGWLRPATESSLVAQGVRLIPAQELRAFGRAAWDVLKSAPEIPYEGVKLDYMHRVVM